ncbi:hypothetical protein AB4033_002269 [Listeria monocytogenes]|nr:hypothetical protein [Listeria monocytogenes]EGA6436234.1 hypothetical protein [Listeria monocytogenes]
MAKLETFYPIVATPKRAGYKEYLPSVQCADDRNFPGNNLVVPDLCNATKCRIYTMKNEYALLK